MNSSGTGISLSLQNSTLTTHVLAQKNLLLKKARYAGVVSADGWEKGGVVFIVNRKQTLRVTREEAWLLLPWDGQESGEMEPFVQAAIHDLSIFPRQVVLVTSSRIAEEGVLTQISSTLGIPVSAIRADRSCVLGDKGVQEAFAGLFETDRQEKLLAIDPGKALQGARVEFQDAMEFEGLLLKSTPKVFMTYVFLGICIAIFGLMAMLGTNPMDPKTADLIAWGADFAPLTLHGEWWRLFTCAFLHIGIVHLFFNMWCLLDLGRLAERLYGNVYFSVLYVYSALGGSMVSLLWNPPNLVSAGASGAVFGLIGSILGFMVVRRGTIPPSSFRRVAKSGLLFIGYNMVFGLSIPNIDNAAHLGGLFTGAVFGALFSRPLPAISGQTLPLRIVGLLLMPSLLYFGATVAIEIKPVEIPVVGAEDAIEDYNRMIHQAKVPLARLVEIETRINDGRAAKWGDRLIDEWVAKIGLQGKRVAAIPLEHEDVQGLRDQLVEGFAHMKEILLALKKRRQTQAEEDRLALEASKLRYSETFDNYGNACTAFARKFKVTFEKR